MSRGVATGGVPDAGVRGRRASDRARSTAVRVARFRRANRASDRARRTVAAPLVALLVSLATALALPTFAAAHGGLLLGSADAGPYRVQLLALAVTRSGVDGAAIDYTAYVQRADDGRPVEDARVRIAVEREDGVRELRVQRIGNGYEGIARVPSSSDVRAYPVRVAVRGPDGVTDLRITPPEDGGPPPALLGGTAVALLSMGGLAATARRRRRATPS